MPLKRAAYLVFAATLVALPARAAEPVGVDERERTTSKSEPQPAPPSASNERLVPLVELKSRKYKKLWWGDFKVHDFSFGITLLAVEVSGEVTTAADPALGSPARNDAVRADVPYYGFHFSYYVPLVGYSTDFSVGLLPELQLAVGTATKSYEATTPVIEDQHGFFGTALRAPLFAMARLGYNASAYGGWPFCVNLGVGAALVRVTTGSPALGAATYLAPTARASLAFGFAEIGAEMELARYDDFSSSSDPIRVSYRAMTFTLSSRLAP